MKKFNVWGSFTVDVDFNIEAENEKEAKKKAKEMLKDNFHLDAYGGLHVPKMADFGRLNIDEEDEE